MGDTYREILKNCCAPIYWYRKSKTGPPEICACGTVTFVDTGEMVLGITAAHVVDGVTATAPANHPANSQVCAQYGRAEPDALAENRALTYCGR